MPYIVIVSCLSEKGLSPFISVFFFIVALLLSTLLHGFINTLLNILRPLTLPLTKKHKTKILKNPISTRAQARDHSPLPTTDHRSVLALPQWRSHPCSLRCWLRPRHPVAPWLLRPGRHPVEAAEARNPPWLVVRIGMLECSGGFKASQLISLLMLVEICLAHTTSKLQKGSFFFRSFQRH